MTVGGWPLTGTPHISDDHSIADRAPALPLPGLALALQDGPATGGAGRFVRSDGQAGNDNRCQFTVEFSSVACHVDGLWREMISLLRSRKPRGAVSARASLPITSAGSCADRVDHLAQIVNSERSVRLRGALARTCKNQR